MKRQFLPGLALLTLLLIATTGSAQTKAPLNEPDRNRPRLFNKMPDEMQVDLSDIDQLILPARSSARSESLMKGDKKCAAFTVQYISATSLYENKVYSVVLRLPEYPGATLTLSSSTNADGTVAYTGRIISFRHGDMYELVKKGAGYIFKKRNFYDVVNE